MSFEILEGDLFTNDFNFDALAQGVNTTGIMGGGVAVEFKRRWPMMFDEYERICDTHGSALAGLMHACRAYQSAFEVDGELFYTNGPDIYNLFTQILPGKGNADLRFLQSSAIAMTLDAEEQGHANVGLPWIGCGIGGLDRWNVEHILAKVFEPSPVHFVLVQKDPVHEPLV